MALDGLNEEIRSNATPSGSSPEQMGSHLVSMNPAPAVFAYPLHHLTSQMESEIETTNTIMLTLSCAPFFGRLCAGRRLLVMLSL
jgi:hypothetical protein